MNQTYINAVRLLLAVAPVVFRKPLFALKGGTAINLFLRDMPRLSVDLDLVYADHRPSREGVSLDGLLETRRSLMAELPMALTDKHRSFLSGLVRCEPDWSLMQCPHLEMMPAIRWKIENLARLKRTNPSKFSRQAEELAERLSR